LAPDMLECQSKAPKDPDYSLVSRNKTWVKNGSLGWRPEPGNISQKCENIPPLWRHPQSTTNAKRKKN